MEENIRNNISNFPKVFYHGTDLRYINLPIDVRKNFLAYCYGLRELLYFRFSQYDIQDLKHSKLKELLGDVVDKEPKVFENLIEALNDVFMSKMSEDFEYGSFYITSNIFSAYMYAKKSYAGGEFAFAAYAMARAAKAIGHEDWYTIDKMPELPTFVDIFIDLAEGTPIPAIIKITDVNPERLRTEQNENVGRYIQNGELHHTEFRYNKDVDLTSYEYYIVDDAFEKRLRDGDFD